MRRNRLVEPCTVVALSNLTHQSTRHRMKRLKRGLPPDEALDHDRGFSATSSSLVSARSSVPPAKRHQPGPPDAMNGSHHLRSPSPVAASTSGPPPQPPQPRKKYNTCPPPLRKVSSQTLNGHTSATGKEYNTCPPDPPRPGSTPSGFSSVNRPPTSNPELSVVPLFNLTHQATRHQMKRGLPPDEALDHDRGFSASPVMPSAKRHQPGPPASTSGPHPPQYQLMKYDSKHNQCDLFDGLGRGIWTSDDGVDMYLRCNHDGCRRMDWRTVHSLQCHIVKIHKQPKGTIGSLQMLLDRYGVPVSEVENCEKNYGLGAAGTMQTKNMGVIPYQQILRRRMPALHRQALTVSILPAAFNARLTICLSCSTTWLLFHQPADFKPADFCFKAI
jgi:hypothetical protein